MFPYMASTQILSSKKKMFLVHQISILVQFLKDHVMLKMMMKDLYLTVIISHNITVFLLSFYCRLLNTEYSLIFKWYVDMGVVIC